MKRVAKLCEVAAIAALTLAFAFPSVRATEVASATAGASAPAGRLPPALPLRRDAPVGAEATTWMPALALLSVAAAAGGLWLWRRGPTRGTGQRLARRQETEVVRLSSQALTQQASVHVVQWQDEEFLLGCTAQHVTLLSRRAATASQRAQA
jgi:hypothetical protein